MGRPSLSDDEKRRRGTYDPRYSAEVRAEAALAKVVSFPTLREIPECMFPLDVEGQKLYDELSRVLFEQKRLTVLSHAELSALCGGMSAERDKISKGKSASSVAFIRFLERIDKLQKAAVDRAYAGSSTEDRPNKFARNGFSARK